MRLVLSEQLLPHNFAEEHGKNVLFPRLDLVYVLLFINICHCLIQYYGDGFEMRRDKAKLNKFTGTTKMTA